MTALASRAYAHRSRNGFLISLWLAKNNPDAFSSLDSHVKRIVLAMLDAQSNQKLGRRLKFQGVITSDQANLLWRIQSTKPSEQNSLLRDTSEYGLDLVSDGYVSIFPDKDLDGWELGLSPEGERLAQILGS